MYWYPPPSHRLDGTIDRVVEDAMVEAGSDSFASEPARPYQSRTPTMNFTSLQRFILRQFL